MELNNINKIYFLGIGGIGMSALARYFNAKGKLVCGYDKTSTKLTDELISEGIEINFEDNINAIPAIFKPISSDVLIVYTPAIPKESKQMAFFKNNNCLIIKRAQLLGMITNITNTIAIAGTHGKTTTSSLVSHVLKSSKINTSAFLGGITNNYNTNLLLSESNGSIEYTVVEADEYDRSFLTLHPEIGVITSVDSDHLDIYGNESYIYESYSLFANQVKTNLIVKKSAVEKLKLNKVPITYSLSDTTADYYSKNIKIVNGLYEYEIVTPKGTVKNLKLGLPGKHNVENSVVAYIVSDLMLISSDEIRRAFESFSGVKRRFEYHIKTERLVYIDDYAHHPEELKATINSVKEMYPSKKITGVFQPHLFSRTRDFMNEFAQSLDLLDECILLDIYPARELPIEKITSNALLEKMKITNKSLCAKKDLVNEIKNRNPEVLLTLGAGDIDTLVVSIKNELLKTN